MLRLWQTSNNVDLFSARVFKDNWQTYLVIVRFILKVTFSWRVRFDWSITVLIEVFFITKGHALWLSVWLLRGNCLIMVRILRKNVVRFPKKSMMKWGVFHCSSKYTSMNKKYILCNLFSIYRNNYVLVYKYFCIINFVLISCSRIDFISIELICDCCCPWSCIMSKFRFASFFSSLHEAHAKVCSCPHA